MNWDREQDIAVWAGGTGALAAGFGGLVACFELNPWTNLPVLLASLFVAFGLRVLALPAALAMLIGWPLGVYGLRAFSLSWCFPCPRFGLLGVTGTWRRNSVGGSRGWSVFGERVRRRGRCRTPRTMAHGERG